MNRARARLEKADYDVLAGWLSPSHDLYVEPKCLRFKSQFYPADRRLKWTRWALRDSEWLNGAGWEAEYAVALTAVTYISSHIISFFQPAA